MITEPDWSTYSVGSAVPKEMRAEIGSVIIFQGSIEFELRVCVSRILRADPDVVETTTAELSYKQLMSLLSSLVIAKLGKTSPLYEDFRVAAGRLDKFEEFRNLIAHSHWSHSLQDLSLPEQAARHKVTAKRGQGLTRSVTEVTLSELQLELKRAVFYNGELFQAVSRIANSDA